MEAINEYNQALVEILRNKIIEHNPEKLEKFNEDVEDTMDFVTDDEEFRDEMLSSWSNITEDYFGFEGYGIHVEVAKQYPELKEQAEDIIGSEFDTRERGYWHQLGVFYSEDACDLKDAVEWIVKIYNQLQKWEKYFNTKFELDEFNCAVAEYFYNSLIFNFKLPEDEDVLRLLPKDVFQIICDNYVVDDLGHSYIPK